MYYTREYLNRAHREIDTIFRVLFPEHGMAVREEQIMLCHEMLDNLLGRNIALCDAGVGIGKTYAYLVGCVLMRKYSLLAEGCSPYEQRPVVISTSSIALQKAILTEYIPFLSRILQENGTIQAPIKAVIRKGKEHFVCDERLEQRIVAIEEKNKNALQKEALLSLKEHYDMDEVSNLSGFDRRMVSVPKFCSGDCPKRGSCRYQQYLERSRDNEMFIQICNHNYLLADGYHRLQDYRPLLKDYRALIVDEAHKLPDAAKQMFGKSLCYDDIREICFYLGKEYQGPEIRKLSGTIRMVLDIIGENHRTRYGIKEEFHMTEECAMYLYEGIQTMNKIIEKLEKKIPKWIRNKLEETRSVLECFFHQDKKYVLHLKQDHDHRIILCASSRRIPQYLDQMLWSRGMGAILTSGTLKTGQGFSHIRKMTGLQRVRRVREYVADSPFEYQKNCLLYLPKDLKTCRRGSQEEAEMIAGHIHSLICSTYGHTLVLFTSYHLMGTVYMEILKKLYLFPERLRCMFLHLWCLGLRASEVCTLKGNAYYQQGEDYWIQVYQVKMKNYKRIPIPQALYQIMKVYLKKHEIQPEEFIFKNSRGGACLYGTFRTQMIEACRENKIANGEYLFQSHDYRHTVATMFYDSHVSLQSIRDYLGHTYEEMTRQYIDYMPQRIAKANDEFFEMQGSSLASWLKKEEKDGK